MFLIVVLKAFNLVPAFTIAGILLFIEFCVAAYAIYRLIRND